ncbi:MAG TPA: nitroreductase family deazaflavin-dependent oxidoreductase [Candidatus Binataceae bacterium]|nr:nitroreductase family deazaflavin-dependent oxidoreductase [Candidatus Binataceae bacterium]
MKKQAARPEPLKERMHVIPRTIRPIQNSLVSAFHGYFSRAPGWVLLTTIGRKSGLPREVLLPCTRTNGEIIVISTYGMRSDWIRNISKNTDVKVTCDGAIVPGRAEIVDDVKKKRALVSKHPFFAPAPFEIVNAVALRLTRPAMVAFLRNWVTDRPVVVIHI